MGLLITTEQAANILGITPSILLQWRKDYPPIQNISRPFSYTAYFKKNTYFRRLKYIKIYMFRSHSIHVISKKMDVFKKKLKKHRKKLKNNKIVKSILE